jgi:hypothetical protein
MTETRADQARTYEALREAQRTIARLTRERDEARRAAWDEGAEHALEASAPYEDEDSRTMTAREVEAVYAANPYRATPSAPAATTRCPPGPLLPWSGRGEGAEQLAALGNVEPPSKEKAEQINRAARADIAERVKAYRPVERVTAKDVTEEMVDNAIDVMMTEGAARVLRFKASVCVRRYVAQEAARELEREHAAYRAKVEALAAKWSARADEMADRASRRPYSGSYDRDRAEVFESCADALAEVIAEHAEGEVSRG